MSSNLLSSGWFIDRSSPLAENARTLHKSMVIKLSLDRPAGTLTGICDDLPGFAVTGGTRLDIADKLERELREYFDVLGHALLKANIVFKRDLADGFCDIIPAFIADIALADAPAPKKTTIAALSPAPVMKDLVKKEVVFDYA